MYATVARKRLLSAVLSAVNVHVHSMLVSIGILLITPLVAGTVFSASFISDSQIGSPDLYKIPYN